MALGLELRQGIDMKDPKVQAVLFGQRARASYAARARRRVMAQVVIAAESRG